MNVKHFCLFIYGVYLNVYGQFNNVCHIADTLREKAMRTSVNKC